MSHPFLLIGSIISLAAIYVLLPQYLGTFFHYRRPKMVTCPETGGGAEVGIASHRAALTSLFDSEQRRVRNCSLWCDGKNCNEACLKNLR